MVDLVMLGLRIQFNGITKLNFLMVKQIKLIQF
jgi:hypothetical protein